jgi:hypothetical protein
MSENKKTEKPEAGRSAGGGNRQAGALEDEDTELEAADEGDEESGDDGAHPGRHHLTPGAEVAPTRRAEERERERHALQHDIVEGDNEPHRLAGSREQLDEAAREADRRTAGHEIPERRRSSEGPPRSSSR